MSALLEIRNLHAFYDKSHILHGVDMDVHPGEIVSLVGRNGAGRSTALKAVMGQVTATGSIHFNGKQIIGRRPFEIAHMGLGYVPENRDIFPTLTVEQNLMLGEKRKRKENKTSRWSLADMYRMFPLLRERRTIPAGVLSGGEQQMLTLCRTLMGAPDLVMIDEPTEGLAPKMVSLVSDYLKILKEHGISILLVEQKLAIALDLSQRVYVMGHGVVVFEGTPNDLRDDATNIRQEWLGI